MIKRELLAWSIVPVDKEEYSYDRTLVLNARVGTYLLIIVMVRSFHKLRRLSLDQPKLKTKNWKFTDQ